MPRGTRGRARAGRGYVLAEVLAAALGALALVAAVQVYAHLWRLGVGGLAAADVVRSAAVLEEALARDASAAGAVRLVGDGSGLELDVPDGGTAVYSFRDGQVFRGEVPLVQGLDGARFWLDLSGARPLAGVDLWGSGRRFRVTAAAGPLV